MDVGSDALRILLTLSEPQKEAWRAERDDQQLALLCAACWFYAPVYYLYQGINFLWS